MKKFIFIFLFCFSFGMTSFAQTQEQPRITGFFSGISLERFFSQVEEKTVFRFFFKKEDVKGVIVKLQADDSKLSEVLNAVFEGTDLHYAIGANNAVFISKGKKLQLMLSDDFFSNVQNTNSEGSAQVGDAFVRNNRFVIGQSTPNQKKAVLSGTISSFETKEIITGALVFEKVDFVKTISDKNGKYTIELPLGRHTIYIQNLGGYIEQRLIDLRGDGELDMAIGESIYSLSEVVVNSGVVNQVSRPEMGVQTLTVSEMKKLPAILGEVDVLKGILVLPGVNSAGEASVGFNVRGGASDQNLVLFENSTLFNPSHLFGFFSAINADMIESVELMKAGIPASYGGRLSSVLQMKPKFGRTDKIGGSGGIGLLTSRLSLEGPIGEKTTFIAGGRTTYSDWVLDYLEDKADFNASRASFFDLNLNVRHTFSDKDKLEFTGYYSQDQFRFDPDTVYSYQNQNLALKWTHYFNDQLEGSFAIGKDAYAFQIVGEDNPLNSYELGFGLTQDFLKAEFRQEKGFDHVIKYGIHLNRITLDPGLITPYGAESIVIRDEVEQERALETSIFISDEFEINDNWFVSGGLRYSLYNYFGPQTSFVYPAGEPTTNENVIGEKTSKNGEVIKTYHGPEFRFSGRYSLDNQSSIKAGVNSMRQNMHLLSNSSVISPTDTWKLSDEFIAPQTGIQYSLGYFRNLKQNQFEFSTEVYYRTMRNLLDYRSGATIVLNDDVEQDVLNTNGKSYGIEFFLKKNAGKLNGSVSYTYARSLYQTSSFEKKEKINEGSEYSSNFDQPHHAVLVMNYEMSKRFNATLSGNYSTGRPITLPVSKFVYAGSERVYYSGRNAQRVPDYFRVDFSINLEGNHKVNKLAHSSWSMGIYNVLGRSNPYSIYYTPESGVLKGYQLSIFAKPIPFITYNFKF
jgi:hypothetical protein